MRTKLWTRKLKHLNVPCCDTFKMVDPFPLWELYLIIEPPCGYFHCHENKDWETDPVAHKKQRKDGGGQRFWYPCFRMPTEKWLDSKGSWTHLKASSGLLWTASGKHKPSHRSSWTPVFDLFTREWSILGLPELGGEDKPSEYLNKKGKHDILEPS